MALLRGMAMRAWRYFTRDGLSKSSTLLALSQLVNAGAIFAFWMICARLFEPSAIGIATSVVALGTLVSAFTTVGLPNTVVRFMSTSKNRTGLFNTTVLLLVAFASAGGLLTLALVRQLSPKLDGVTSSVFLSVMFVLLAVCINLETLLDCLMLSLQESRYILYRITLKGAALVVVPFGLMALDTDGILASYLVAACIGICFAVYVAVVALLRPWKFNLDYEQLFARRKFAIGNYTAGVFAVLPGSLLPLIVLNSLGAEEAAFFFLPLQLAILLDILSSSSAMALFAEASQPDSIENFPQQVIDVARRMLVLLTCAVVPLTLLGKFILLLYGNDYAQNGYVPLLILLASSYFVGINWLGDIWLNVHQRMVAYLVMNAVNALSIVSLTYALSRYGLMGVSAGWLLGQGVSASVYVVFFRRWYVVKTARRPVTLLADLVGRR